MYKIKTYSDSTFMRMTKKELIEYIRMTEENWKAAERTIEIQVENLTALLEEEKKKGMQEVLNTLRDRATYMGDCYEPVITRTQLAVLQEELNK